MRAFDCKMCGHCCLGKGGIFLQPEEIDRIAAFVKETPESFTTRFCYRKNGRVYIKSGSDDYCIFFDRDKQCLIHPVKPRPCSAWPYYPALLKDEGSWRMAQEACPGINPHCTHETFISQSKKRQDK